MMCALLILAAAAGAVAAGAVVPPAAPPAVSAAARLERVVIMMRHGVRPPTKQLPLPADIAPGPWPSWPVAPGELTPHGAAGIALLGAADRAHYRAAGLFPTGCPALTIVADSDQRTIATARAYADAFAPGCAPAIDHLPQGAEDPRFSPIDSGAQSLDPAKARAAVLGPLGPGGVAAAERQLRPLITRIDQILCGEKRRGCGVGGMPTMLDIGNGRERPSLSGALDRGSTAAQILLLQYADGKPKREIGWGRATAADVTALSALHAAEFRIVARPRYIAQRNFAAMAALVRAALLDDAPATGAPGGPRVLMISGHDTQIANLGGLLDTHWQIPGFAADDPSPGGAIIIERWRDARGPFVRAYYRSQRLDAIRTLAATPPMRQVLRLPACPARCSPAAFMALIERRED